MQTPVEKLRVSSQLEPIDLTTCKSHCSGGTVSKSHCTGEIGNKSHCSGDSVNKSHCTGEIGNKSHCYGDIVNKSHCTGETGNKSHCTRDIVNKSHCTVETGNASDYAGDTAVNTVSAETNISDGSVRSDTAGKHNALSGGWVLIGKTAVPYIWRGGQQYLSVSVLRYAAAVLRRVPDTAVQATRQERDLLNELCLGFGIPFTFKPGTSMISLKHLVSINTLISSMLTVLSVDGTTYQSKEPRRTQTKASNLYSPYSMDKRDVHHNPHVVNRKEQCIYPFQA